MSDSFIFGTASSQTLGGYVFRLSVDDSPMRSYTTLKVPGRNGDLLLDNKTYDNIVHSYKVILANASGVDSALTNFKNALAAQIGYQRLTDSIHTDEFYMAVFKAALKPVLTSDRKFVKFTVEFNRKPQRFLTSGESVTTMTTSGSISNPTLCEAKPLIRVYGTGTIKIGNITLTLSANASYTDLDFELMDAYRGTTNLNANVSSSSVYWPTFKAGSNNIVISSGITKLEITPRWWRL